MAKIKIFYDTNEPSKQSIIVDELELIGNGVTHYSVKVAKQDADTECTVGFDYVGHEVEFDGRVVVDGVRLPLELSSSIMRVLVRHLMREIGLRLTEMKRSYEHGCGDMYNDEQRRVAPVVLDQAIQSIEHELHLFMEDVSKGKTFEEISAGDKR